MKEKLCNVTIDNKLYTFSVKGDFFWGDNETLFKSEDNIISKVQWVDKGFNIVDAFSEQEFKTLKNSIKKNIILAIKSCGIQLNEEEFELNNYHKVITNDELHNQVINKTRNLENKDFNFDIDLLADRLGEVLGYKLTSWVEELQKSHIQIRISRPNSLDINPPHRDGYLSYWEDIINVWIPVEGCNEKSSLPVYVGSHLIPENEILRTASKGAEINGNIYYVPCILKTKKGGLKMERPNPKNGQALLFTPFLIHGAAVNNNDDTTRISLELRFPKVDI